MSSGFEPTGAPPPRALSAARTELHWAAQLLAAAARALVRPEADDSHTSLEWMAGARLFAGAPVAAGAGVGLRAALRPVELTLAVVDASDAVAAELPLPGRTFDEAMAWLGRALSAPAGTVLSRPPYDMPQPPVAPAGAGGAGGAGGGWSFDGRDAPALAELARWYAMADRILRQMARSTPGASAVRCWPHHFDIATQLPASGPAPDLTPTPAPTIGIGLSPGDGSYPEPYWYVTPWPSPKDPPKPPLPGGGGWHTEGWFGAVLTATAALEAGDRMAGGPVGSLSRAAAADEVISRFLGTGISVLRAAKSR